MDSGCGVYLNQPPSLHDESILKSIDDESIDLLLCSHWCLTDILHDLGSPVDDVLVCPRGGDYLNQWYVVWRIDLKNKNTFTFPFTIVTL